MDSYVPRRLCQNPHPVRLPLETALPQLDWMLWKVIQQGVQGDLQRIRNNGLQSILCERGGIHGLRDGQKDGLQAMIYPIKTIQ